MVVVWLTGSCDSKVDGKAFSTDEKEHLDEGNWLTTRVIQSGEEMTAIPFLIFTRTVSLKPSSEARQSCQIRFRARDGHDRLSDADGQKTLLLQRKDWHQSMPLVPLNSLNATKCYPIRSEKVSDCEHYLTEGEDMKIPDRQWQNEPDS